MHEQRGPICFVSRIAQGDILAGINELILENSVGHEASDPGGDGDRFFRMRLLRRMADIFNLGRQLRGGAQDQKGRASYST